MLFILVAIRHYSFMWDAFPAQMLLQDCIVPSEISRLAAWLELQGDDEGLRGIMILRTLNVWMFLFVQSLVFTLSIELNWGWAVPFLTLHALAFLQILLSIFLGRVRASMRQHLADTQDTITRAIGGLRIFQRLPFRLLLICP